MKTIIYSAVDNGIDGMEKESVLYSSFDEAELKSQIQKDPSRAWRRVKEQIIDTDSAKQQAFSKLNGIDRLVLGLPSWIEDKIKKY